MAQDDSAPPASATPERPTPVVVGLDSRMLRKSLAIIIVFALVYELIRWSWSMLASFLFLILLAWMVAISFDPIVTYLARRGMKRGTATGLVFLVLIVSIAAFIGLLGGALATQIAELITALPDLIVKLVDWVNHTFHSNIDPVALTDATNLTPQQLAQLASNFAGGFFGILFSVLGIVFDGVTVLVFAFYLSADSPRIKRFIASWLRPDRQVVFIRVWDISVHKAGGFVISKLALATISAFFHSIFFFIIDIPYWLPMGIFAGVVAQFIPTIGTYIGVALPALFAVFEQPLDVIWIVLFATVYQQIENYVLTPRISTKTMDINSGVALASVFVGAALFGPIGAIIGIPLAAIIIAIVSAYGHRYPINPEVAAAVAADATQPKQRRAPWRTRKDAAQ